MKPKTHEIESYLMYKWVLIYKQYNKWLIWFWVYYKWKFNNYKIVLESKTLQWIKNKITRLMNKNK